MTVRLWAALLPIGPIRLTPLVQYAAYGSWYCAYTVPPA